MSQILMPEKRTRGISQDIILLEQKHYLSSSASPVFCIECNRGLEDGYSLTAKKTSTGTSFFCEKHYRF